MNKAAKEDPQLTDDIERKRSELNLRGAMLTSRRLLKMIYGNLASDKNMLEICTIRHLSEIRWEKLWCTRHPDLTPEQARVECEELEDWLWHGSDPVGPPLECSRIRLSRAIHSTTSLDL